MLCNKDLIILTFSGWGDGCRINNLAMYRYSMDHLISRDLDDNYNCALRCGMNQNCAYWTHGGGYCRLIPFGVQDMSQRSLSFAVNSKLIHFLLLFCLVFSSIFI